MYSQTWPAGEEGSSMAAPGVRGRRAISLAGVGIVLVFVVEEGRVEIE